MRLLEYGSAAGDLRLTGDLPNDKVPRYAILSHTWGDEEVLLADLSRANPNGKGKRKAGHAKIQFCRDQTCRDGLRFFWVDTCCIDKTNNTELQEAINSMFRWYRNATKCYVYLADVTAPSPSDINNMSTWEPAFLASRWFTRGWTLQELIAPSTVEFFSREGVRLGDRKSLEHLIRHVTGIPLDALRGAPLSKFSVSERLAWIEKRNTTREEDKAYSLFGIFDVQLPLLYGEGEKKAFRRLREEIARSSVNTLRVSGGEQETLARKEKAREILRRLYTSPYEDRKDLNPDRVEGTCEWFVSHELFRDWLESKTSKMLWVSADPGCGKSVLAKHLVDSVLPTTESRTVCYFFFKDGFEDQISATSALCCILHQLFKRKRNLLSGAVLEQFDASGEAFTTSFSGLWQTLINAVKDEEAGEIVCILDAIDECESQSWAQLAKGLCSLFGTETNFNLKFLLTSRPYDGIRRSFQRLAFPGLPVIHLSGESDTELEKISREIGLFIQARVRDIRTQLALTSSERDILLKQLLRVPNRTYLWVHLTLDLIENAFRIDKYHIVKATSQLPKTVDEAYDRILSKSADPKMAIKILHIVVAATRPLTVSEMSLAFSLKGRHRSYNDLDLGPEERFRRDVRHICGLFVTIIDSKIYLLHQTAREFLVPSSGVGSFDNATRSLRWKHSLQPQISQEIVANICIRHLLFDEFERRPLSKDESPAQYTESYTFLDYSAKNWAAHLRESTTGFKQAMRRKILRICDTSSSRFFTWFRIHWTTISIDFPEGFTNFMVAAYFGLDTVVKYLREEHGCELDVKDCTHHRSALSWAAGNGFDNVVRVMIEDTGFGLGRIIRRLRRRERVNSVDGHGRTPLTYAVWNGKMAVVELLMTAGAKLTLPDEIGGTPLSYAICSGREELIELLLKKKMEADTVYYIARRLLFSAIDKGDEAVIELLVTTGRVDANLVDEQHRTLLYRAVEQHNPRIVRMLLDTGRLDINTGSRYGLEPFSLASRQKDLTIARMLLETGGVDSESINTSLLYASRAGRGDLVKLLIETGKADVETTDVEGQTALSHAAYNGSIEILSYLLHQGANINTQDNKGRTPLHRAAIIGQAGAFDILLLSGADVTFTSGNMFTLSDRSPP